MAQGPAGTPLLGLPSQLQAGGRPGGGGGGSSGCLSFLLLHRVGWDSASGTLGSPKSYGEQASRPRASMAVPYLQPLSDQEGSGVQTSFFCMVLNSAS